jgi:hypothetical protein
MIGNSGARTDDLVLPRSPALRLPAKAGAQDKLGYAEAGVQTRRIAPIALQRAFSVKD